MNDKDKKYFTLISKILYILTRILRVMVCIAIAAMLFATILLFLNSSNIKVENDIITILDEEFIYENDGTTVLITSKENGEGYYITADNNVFAVEDAESLLLSIKLLFIYAIITLIFGYVMLYHISNVFKNLNKENTPFVKNNIVSIRNFISTYVIANIISLIYLFAVKLVINTNMDFNIALDVLTYVGIMLIIYYIFKYGYDLENKKNTQ